MSAAGEAKKKLRSAIVTEGLDRAPHRAFLRATGLTPAEIGMLIAGLPPRDGLQYDVEAGGLRRASFGDVVVTFDPPSFPARNVVVTRGEDRVEIEHLEVVH